MTWGNNLFQLVIITPTGGFTGLFLYSPAPGTGKLIGSWTSAAGTDPFGNGFPKGINVTSGLISGVTLSAIASETMNPGPFILDASSGLTITTFTTVGSNNWTAPAGVTSVQALCWGGGAGGDGGDAGEGEAGGGGGAFSQLTLAVTPATVYHPIVGAGGAHNVAGGNSSFAGDTQTVTANGAPAVQDPPVQPNGGAASTTPAGVISFAGGNGHGVAGGANVGGGGGSAGSNIQAGNDGQQGSGSTPGAGGATTPGGNGFNGGAGGAGGANGAAGANGVAPGGGGGGGGANGAGGSGANGEVILVYSTGATATNIILSTTSGTDPATGFAYSGGITTSDPTFGDQARFFGANVVIGASSTWTISGASVDVATVGQGLAVKEGTNAKQGTATLAAGTVTVANTNVTANSRIFLTAQTTGAGPGALRVSARTAGTSFTITSSNAGDTSLVAWEIFEPG